MRSATYGRRAASASLLHGVRRLDDSMVLAGRRGGWKLRNGWKLRKVSGSSPLQVKHGAVDTKRMLVVVVEPKTQASAIEICRLLQLH